MTDKSRTVQTDAGEIEFLDGVIVGGRQRMKLAKTISAGGEVGSNGLRFSVSVQWHPRESARWPGRYVQVKVSVATVYQSQEFNTDTRELAKLLVHNMLHNSEPDLCKYLTRALMEVEL